MVFTVGGVTFMTPFTCVIVSNAHIFSIVLKLPPVCGIRKPCPHVVPTSLWFPSSMGQS
jgi:olfactory receptor